MNRILIVCSILALWLCCGCSMRNGVLTKFDPLTDNEYNRYYKLSGPMEKVTSITIHNTANKATAMEERNYLNRRHDKVFISFHYAVDEKKAVQIMPENIHGWHAGDGRGKGNMESIAIEICRSTHPDLTLYSQAEENAVHLAAWLLDKHHLSIDDLRMHKDWSGKHCPHRILDDNSWDSFKQRVAQSMATLKRMNRIRKRINSK